MAVVVSADSDLALPMRIVRRQLQLPIGLLKPCDWYANELVRAATFWKPIRKGVLAASQLPQQLMDEHGTTYEAERLVAPRGALDTPSQGTTLQDRHPRERGASP